MRGLLVGLLAVAAVGTLAADPAEARGRRGKHVAAGYAKPVVVYRYAPRPTVVRYRAARPVYYAPRPVAYFAPPTSDFYDSYDNRPPRVYGYRSARSYGYGYVSAPPSKDYVFGTLATRGTGTTNEAQRFFTNHMYRQP